MKAISRLRKHFTKNRLKRIQKETLFWSKVTLFVAGALLLIGNILASQLQPPLYFSLVNEDRDSAVHFLKAVRNIPQYKTLLAMQKNIYGADIENDVNFPLLRKERIIDYLQELLKKKPNDPELLYGLSIVYREQGNSKEADTYLGKAKSLDPAIGQE